MCYVCRHYIMLFFLLAYFSSLLLSLPLSLRPSSRVRPSGRRQMIDHLTPASSASWLLPFSLSCLTSTPLILLLLLFSPYSFCLFLTSSPSSPVPFFLILLILPYLIFVFCCSLLTPFASSSSYLRLLLSFSSYSSCLLLISSLSSPVAFFLLCLPLPYLISVCHLFYILPTFPLHFNLLHSAAYPSLSLPLSLSSLFYLSPHSITLYLHFFYLSSSSSSLSSYYLMLPSFFLSSYHLMLLSCWFIIPPPSPSPYLHLPEAWSPASHHRADQFLPVFVNTGY